MPTQQLRLPRRPTFRRLLCRRPRRDLLPSLRGLPSLSGSLAVATTNGATTNGATRAIAILTAAIATTTHCFGGSRVLRSRQRDPCGPLRALWQSDRSNSSYLHGNRRCHPASSCDAPSAAAPATKARQGHDHPMLTRHHTRNQAQSACWCATCPHLCSVRCKDVPVRCKN